VKSSPHSPEKNYPAASSGVSLIIPAKAGIQDAASSGGLNPSYAIKIIFCRTEWEATCIDNAEFSDSKMSHEFTHKHSLFP